MNPYTIIFIGPQGSGKGTQITLLDRVLRGRGSGERVVTLQTGRLFRALAERGVSYTERRVAETLNRGVLQPHFLTAMLWAESLARALDPESHLLIDGVPRTLPQTEFLDEAFRFYGRKEVTIVNFVVPKEVARARMQSRGRGDDTPKAIEERLRLYERESVLVLDFYRDRPDTKVLDIDATGTIEDIHTEILHRLGLRSASQ